MTHNQTIEDCAKMVPPFPKQTQDAPGQESKMNPRPDYGYVSYKGYGRMKDKIAIVTGGDSGIGRAVALAYAREGADVVVAFLKGKEEEDANETKKAIEESGRKCLLVGGDLSQEADCIELVNQTVKQFGRIDILVNNAATQRKAVESFEKLDYETVLYTFKTNIISMFVITKHALPHMKEGSAIINTGSIQAYQPSANILDYAATKGAIVAFTKGLSQELIQKKIRVNCVAPGPVWTPLIVQSFDEEKVSKFGEQVPINRPAQPVELASAYVFLASSESTYISGEILAVTGGKPTA